MKVFFWMQPPSTVHSHDGKVGMDLGGQAALLLSVTVAAMTNTAARMKRR
jgi:hypothetical protein